MAMAATMVLGAATAASVRRPSRSSAARVQWRHCSAIARRAGGDRKKISELEVGDMVTGKVTRVANIGIWMDIGAEKDALLPKDQLSGGETFQTGNKIEGLRIFELSDGDKPSDRKIRVTGIKPMAQIKVGDEMSGTVKNIMEYGIFFDAGLKNDVLAPERYLSKPLADFKKGEVFPIKIEKVEGQRITVRTLTAGGSSTSSTPFAELKVGQRVPGKVKFVKEDVGVFVDIGAEGDALCRPAQLPKELSEYQTGEEISGLRVVAMNLQKGFVEVSPRRLPSEVKEGDQFEGSVENILEFGVFFDAGLAASVLAPTRLLSKPIEEYTKGEVADLTVTKVDGDKVAVTTKANVGVPISSLVRGTDVSGTVIRVTPGVGLFINIGAMADALLRVSSLPKELDSYKEGDKVEGMFVVNADAALGNIEVAVKDVTPTDLGKPLSEFTAGEKVNGKVQRLAPFGVFVDVGAERLGLWPTDQLPKPAKEYKVGEEITGLNIAQVDVAANRLTVSTKPGASSFNVGDSVTGTVTQIKPFGVFVDIGASAQALAGQRLLEKEPGEYAVGETLELKVTNVNVNENKIAVGQLDRPKVASGPQVESRNFADIKVGEKVKGIVRVAKDYGVFVDIGLPRRDGLMPTSYMGSRASTDFEPNQEVEVYVVRIDAGTERVTLSIEEPKEDEFGGRKRRGFSPAPDYIPSGDMAVDREYYINVHCDGDESYVWDEPLPWKEWETKYPGIVTFPKIETEVYPPAKGGGGGFSGLEELHKAQSVYIPMPVHLRRPDAGPPDQPRDDLDDYQIGYDYGIKPEIHVKYRTPPFNDPNWTFDRRAGSLYPDLMYTDDKQK